MFQLRTLRIKLAPDMIFNIPQVSLEDNALQLHDEQQ